MSSSLANLYAAAEGQGHELPMSPYLYGAIAFTGFVLLLAVLWAFRGTAQKMSSPHTHTRAPERG